MARVLIDGYNLALDKGTGVATYARNLSLELHRNGHDVAVLYGKRSSTSRDPLLREVSFFDGKTGPRPGSRPDVLDQVGHAIRGPLGQKAVEVPTTGRVIAQAFAGRLPYFDTLYNAPDGFRRAQSAFKLWGGLSDIRLPERPDLAHWTYPLPVQVRGRPNIYTLHDLVPLRLPYTTLDHKRNYLRLLRRLQRSADHFVTVSECSRRDLIDILGIEPERVTNTYQSVDIPAALRNKPEAEVAAEVERLTGVGFGEYFLFWGSIEPKKNIGRMIEAYITSGVKAPLVIVGAQAWKSGSELQLLGGGAGQSVRAAQNVVRLSYLPFNLLVSLIRGARGALFPSLYEGFGLPVLEAMQLRTPVLCSNTASLPEVAGDAALMVDPYDIGALTAAIRRLDADADLRTELRERGVGQAERFSPAAYRDRLGALYRRLV